jgi:RNA polymerase sigma-B factor
MIEEVRQRAIDRYVAEPTLSNRNALVHAHRYLCRRGARKFFRNTVDRADLEQVAAIGLIKASMRYSRDYQTPFEAYAWLMIVGELMHFVRDHEGMVRIPRELRSLERRYCTAYERLCAELEREPTARELALELGVSLRVLDQLRILRTQRLVEDDADDGKGGFREHPRPRIPALPSEVAAIDERLALASALHKLSERERHIVREIFFQQRTQAEVGRTLGISQRQVSRVLSRTLQRLARLIAA